MPIKEVHSKFPSTKAEVAVQNFPQEIFPSSLADKTKSKKIDEVIWEIFELTLFCHLLPATRIKQTGLLMVIKIIDREDRFQNVLPGGRQK